jgi:hypothetical protein
MTKTEQLEAEKKIMEAQLEEANKLLYLVRDHVRHERRSGHIYILADDYLESL